MIGKIIGAVVGLAGGFPGALAGALLGHMFDSMVSSTFGNSSQTGQRSSRRRVTDSDFAVSFIALTAAVMKADGRVLRSELNFVKEFLRKQFGPEKLPSNMELLKAALDENYNLQEICYEIRQYMDRSSRGQLVYYLLQVAQADNDISQSEERLIQRIAQWLGVSQMSYISMRAMFGGGGSSYYDQGRQRSQTHRPRTTSLSNHYRVLGIDKSATDDEVKKAYRTLAKQHHPDKLRHLSKKHQESGEEKFQKVQEAYEAVKKSRGMK